MIDKDKQTAKKRVWIYEENDTSIASLKTSNYIAGVDEASVDDIDTDYLTITSTQSSQRLLAPK